MTIFEVQCCGNENQLRRQFKDYVRKGELLFDFIIKTNLSVTPAVHRSSISPARRSGAIWKLHLTLLTNNETSRVENWGELHSKPFSDHIWIRFSINLAVEVINPFRGPRGIGWRKLSTTDELEPKNRLSKVSSPANYNKQALPPRWNEYLSNLR